MNSVSTSLRIFHFLDYFRSLFDVTFSTDQSKQTKEENVFLDFIEECEGVVHFFIICM